MALLKRKSSFWSAEILPLLREAGYNRPTLLQQKVIPLIIKGKDVAVEAEEGSGKTAAFILPLILKIRRGKPGIKAVVLTSSLEKSRKIFRELKRFSSRERKKISSYAFGIIEDRRKESRILSRSPDILIGTPDRVIDHIRRGNLHFSQLQTTVIDKPEDREKPGFEEDLKFIFSKFPPKKQTVLFAPTLLDGTEAFLPLLKHPVLVPSSSWKEPVPRLEEIFLVTGEDNRLSALIRLTLTRKMDSLLILGKDSGSVKRAAGALKRRKLPVLTLLDDFSPLKQKRICEAFNFGKSSILVSTFSAAGEKNLRWVTHIITLGTEDQYFQLQEIDKVQIKKEHLPAEDEQISGLIQQILQKIKEEDPDELNRLRKIIRKNVPIYFRSYFMTYLFKSTLHHTRKKREGLIKLFISIGKNRRVFPNDLINLFTDQLHLNRSQIGEVKVLDNYSFIDIQSSYAGKAITELSGTEFKGRRITVNFAHKKEKR